MRLDRFLTLKLIHPLRRVAGADSRPRVPILMYHSISSDLEPAVAPYYKTNTSPAIFRHHISFLVEQGYRSVDLPLVVERLRQQLPLPEKSVVITFDDGFRNFYTEAFPVLRKHEFTATVFLPTGFIQTPRRSFKNQECLTWDEVRELRKGGIQFGSHTVTHPRLLDLAWTEIQHELRASKSELEQQIGEPISSFAHPYAFPQADNDYVRGFREVLEESGYSCCVTTRLGRVKTGDDPFNLKRLPANTLDDLPFFGAKLNGDYDWLAVPQRGFKKFKRQGLRNSSKCIS